MAMRLGRSDLGFVWSGVSIFGWLQVGCMSALYFSRTIGCYFCIGFWFVSLFPLLAFSAFCILHVYLVRLFQALFNIVCFLPIKIKNPSSPPSSVQTVKPICWLFHQSTCP